MVVGFHAGHAFYTANGGKVMVQSDEATGIVLTVMLGNESLVLKLTQPQTVKIATALLREHNLQAYGGG